MIRSSPVGPFHVIALGHHRSEWPAHFGPQVRRPDKGVQDSQAHAHGQVKGAGQIPGLGGAGGAPGALDQFVEQGDPEEDAEDDEQ